MIRECTPGSLASFACVHSSLTELCERLIYRSVTISPSDQAVALGVVQALYLSRERSAHVQQLSFKHSTVFTSTNERCGDLLTYILRSTFVKGVSPGTNGRLVNLKDLRLYIGPHRANCDFMTAIQNLLQYVELIFPRYHYPNPELLRIVERHISTSKRCSATSGSTYPRCSRHNPPRYRTSRSTELPRDSLSASTAAWIRIDALGVFLKFSLQCHTGHPD